MPEKYAQYLKLSEKQKKKRIQKAEQHQKYRKPNPQGNYEFDQYSWINFQVEQDGKKIKLETYKMNAKGKQIGLVFMFHGLNSYVGHGAHIAAYFSEKGLTTVGFDHRGFGRSEGRGGYVQNLQAHLEDSLKFVNMVIPLFVGIPKFIMGLSMGGMTSFYLSLQHPELFEGAILMAPAMKTGMPGGLVSLTSTLASILPDKAKLLKPVYGKASKNPQISDFVKKDKYSFADRMYLSTIDMIISTMKITPKRFPEYKCPFMIIQGGLDKLVDPDVAFDLYEHSATKKEDKEILFYEDMWHDIWHQQEIHDIIPKMTEWILKRIQLSEKKCSNNT